MDSLLDDLTERTDVAENVVKFIKRSCSQIDYRQRNLDLARESVVERMMEIELIRESLEKGANDLEHKETAFRAFEAGKKRKLASEEEELSVRREELMNGIRLREERLYDQRDRIERFEADDKDARRVVADREKELDERMIAVEERENEFKSTVERRMSEVAVKEEKLRVKWEEFVEAVRLSDERLGEKEREFNSGMERRMSELAAKEEELSVKWREFVEEVRLVDEKMNRGFSERLECAERKLEGLSVSVDERLREKECSGNLVWESVGASLREANLIRESMEKQVEEFEKEKRDFCLYEEEKMLELDLKRQQLRDMRQKLVKDAEFRDEELIKRERRGNQLLKRLNFAEEKAVELKNTLHERFKEIGLKEVEVKSIRDWVEEKMDEADVKGKELEEREMRIVVKKDDLISMENVLREKKKQLYLKEKNLDLEEKNLVLWRKERELDAAQGLNEKRFKELDMRERSVKSVKEFNRKCYKENRAMREKLRIEKDLIEKRATDLDRKERELKYVERGLEFKEKQLVDRVSELGLDEAVDLKFVVRMDGKTLQMFLNDPAKDLESMSDEIFKVLHLSSDPAKLVLDAMVGFYPPHLRKGDLEVNVRRTCITVLEQLIKMSRKIKPCIREAAIELAGAWKSKMIASAENPLEVLGFLHLLAAYDLASYFAEDEILSFLMMVAQYRQRPMLCRVLGFAEIITD